MSRVASECAADRDDATTDQRRRLEERRRPGRHRATAGQPWDQRSVTTYNSAVAHRPEIAVHMSRTLPQGTFHLSWIDF
ncbi:uncharacterized protein LOC143902209 isoform X2 [Temnothorax americanus]|uniref:uncharacterized protein LOC143902209 isoform X2 n=1 Tax=Temnothorax americanus TaxID=1964332 RepID=UPI0040698BEF